MSRPSMMYGELEDPSPSQPSFAAVTVKFASPSMTIGVCGVPATITFPFSGLDTITLGRKSLSTKSATGATLPITKLTVKQIVIQNTPFFPRMSTHSSAATNVEVVCPCKSWMMMLMLLCCYQYPSQYTKY